MYEYVASKKIENEQENLICYDIPNENHAYMKNISKYLGLYTITYSHTLNSSLYDDEWPYIQKILF